MKSNKLPNKAKELMERIHNLTDENEFILYGGVPIDILLNKDIKIHDLDIAIKDFNKYKIKRFGENIKRKGFKIIEPHRKYYIYKKIEVILLYAKNKELFLDVVFLKEPKLIGQFNIETLYFRYPQLDYIDNFNALDGIKKKKIKLIRSLKEENPHLLLGRLLRLCSKYNISLKDKNTEKILFGLKNQLKKWKIKDNLNNNSYLSCISSLFKSIVQSHNKKDFIEDMINKSILKIIFPEINNIDLDKKNIINEISKIKTKLEVIILFDKCIKSKSNKQSFRNKIKELKIRKWDKEDFKCSKYFK